MDKEAIRINKYLSDNGYKLIYNDGCMYEIYKVHKNILEIVQGEIDGSHSDTIFIGIDDLKDIMSNL